jgi:hypothetical protein
MGNTQKRLSFDEVLAAVAAGATIGGCADIMIGEEFIGYPADDVGPEDCGARRVSEVAGLGADGWLQYQREVLVPYRRY